MSLFHETNNLSFDSITSTYFIKSNPLCSPPRRRFPPPPLPPRGGSNLAAGVASGPSGTCCWPSWTRRRCRCPTCWCWWWWPSTLGCAPPCWAGSAWDTSCWGGGGRRGRWRRTTTAASRWFYFIFPLFLCQNWELHAFFLNLDLFSVVFFCKEELLFPFWFF